MSCAALEIYLLGEDGGYDPLFKLGQYDVFLHEIKKVRVKGNICCAALESGKELEVRCENERKAKNLKVFLENMIWMQGSKPLGWCCAPSSNVDVNWEPDPPIKTVYG